MSSPFRFIAGSRVRSLVALAVIAAAPLALPAQAKDYSDADVSFMQGMIGHHAQALVMAAMAAGHGASDRIVLLCKKITISQTDEIKTMRQWLRERHETVPAVDTGMASMDMSGMKMDDHGLMPGMLTSAQMQQLAQARDTAFDRLFLVDMMQHHRGALRMVSDLLNTPGSAQSAVIFQYANDVTNDQQAEINRMQQMLTTYTGGKSE